MARFLKNRQKAQGQAPGSLIFIGKQKMEKTRIRVIQYNKENIIEEEPENIDNVKSYIKKGYITWINIDGLHNTNPIEQLGSMFNLTSLALEDILNTDQRPKFIEDENNIVVFLKAFLYEKDARILSSEQISFIVADNYLITIQERVGDYFDPVRNRLRKSKGKIRFSDADYLCYTLLDSIVDSYIMNISVLGDIIEDQEEAILKGTNRRIIEDIYRHKTEMSFIRKSVRPVKEIMTHIIKSESKFIHPKTLIYLNDLDDLTVYHTNLSNRVNDVMKVLTIFASIFIPLTFIAGVYGTNFDYLPELHFKYSYFIMLGVMAIVAVIMLIFFSRKKWL